MSLPESHSEEQPAFGSREQLQEQVTALGPWFHNMWLGGIRTAPDHFLFDYPNVKYMRFRDAIPADLTGKTVLDIGCNAGFYSMEMKRRGASRVLGIDTDERYLAQARFAASVQQLMIDYQRMSVWEIAGLQEKFDLVIFMGVLYHLRHPLLALDLIHEHVAKDLFLFQSLQRGASSVLLAEADYDFKETAIFDEAGYPKMHFIEKNYCGDPTNWWLPNRACTEAMLRSSGFSILARPEDEVYLCRANQQDTRGVDQYCVYPQRASVLTHAETSRTPVQE